MMSTPDSLQPPPKKKQKCLALNLTTRDIKKTHAQPRWIPVLSSHLFNHHASGVPALCAAVTV
jgi:hypothetical protein